MVCGYLVVRCSVGVASRAFLICGAAILSAIFRFVREGGERPQGQTNFSRICFVSLTDFHVLGGVGVRLPHRLLPLRHDGSKGRSRSQRLTSLSLRSFQVIGLGSRRLVSPAGSRCDGPFPVHARSDLHRPIPSRLVRIVRDTFTTEGRGGVDFNRVFHVVNVVGIRPFVPFRSIRVYGI